MDILYTMLENWAKTRPAAPAILEPGREWLTYGDLFKQVTYIGLTFRALGLGTTDTVAVVMPQSGALATTILGALSYVTCTPLNPAYTCKEFLTYLTDLEVKAVVVEAAFEAPVAAAAQELKIPLIRLHLDNRITGLFSFENTPPPASEAIPQTLDDLTYISHTSGTTAHPKIVPSSQRLLLTRVYRAAEAYRLNQADRSLIILPLFHGMSLNFQLLASMVVGAGVIVVPTFSTLKFTEYLENYGLTWFSATPTIALAILTHIEGIPAPKSHLRFIDIGGAGISGQMIEKLEDILKVPVIGRYGLTEAGLIPLVPLPPSPRKAGSVGIARKAEVAIMDEQGNLLEPGKPGELVLRGPTVFAGYRNNPEATALAFRNEWFRTGDLAYLDRDGYLFISGRLKELINRGGEKIMPSQVDEALLAHPAIAQAATFAIPHPTLGEAVAAAVVVKAGQTVPEPELRSFLVERLAYFKIPSKFIFAQDIPKNATGKIERLKLAAWFGLDTLPQLPALELTEQNKPSSGSVEAAIFQIWSEVLRHSNFGLDHNFFDLGGTSIEGAAIIALVQQQFARLVTVTTLVEYPTLRLFSLAVRRAEPIVQGGPLQTLQDKGNQSPFFIIHGAEGYGYHFHDLAKLLAPDIPVYAFTSIGRPGEELLEFEIPALSRIYITELRKVQPHGPYRLAGHSSGGWLALEMSAQLQRSGEEIEFLGMFDSSAPHLWKWYSSPIQNWLQRHSLPFVDWLATALQPEITAYWSRLLVDGIFNEELLVGMTWGGAVWYLWHYLRRKTGRAVPLVGRLPSKITRRVPLKYKTTIWELSKYSVGHQAEEITRYLQAHPESLEQSDLKGLVRAAWHGLHIQGSSLYRARPYHGEVVIFQAEEESSVKLKEWQKVVKGPIRIHKVKGNHGTLVRVPHARNISTLLRKYLQS